MKLVFVTNEHDNAVAVPKRAAFQKLGITDAEVHVVDFEQARQVLPITTAPCVFILAEELEGDFDLDNIGKVKNGVRAMKLPKGQKKDKV